MEIKGTISNLTTQGTVSNFVLRGADGSETRIQSSRPLPPGVKNGSLVVVNGHNPPDPPFLADSVEKLDAPKTPWLLIGVIALVLLLIIGLGIYFLIPRGGSTWTIHATDSAAAASNVPIQLLDSNNQPLKTVATDANGDAVFKDLANGTYYASGPGVSTPVSAAFSQAGSKQTSPLAVKSPFTWTVNTTLCGHPDANNQLQLESPAKEIVKIGVTDATGKFVFTNLETGAYTVFGPNNLSGSATLNGTSAPSPITLTIPPPPIGCLVIGPIFHHPLMYAVPPAALKERLQKP